MIFKNISLYSIVSPAKALHKTNITPVRPVGCSDVYFKEAKDLCIAAFKGTIRKF
jgi:hypothetical protein